MERTARMGRGEEERGLKAGWLFNLIMGFIFELVWEECSSLNGIGLSRFNWVFRDLFSLECFLPLWFYDNLNYKDMDQKEYL